MIKEKIPQKPVVESEQLFQILGSQVTVLPPDTRHVGCNVIPVRISDGCLYK